MMTKLEMYQKQKQKGNGDKMFMLFRCDDNYEAYYDDAENISEILSVQLQTIDSTPTISITEAQCNELLDAGHGVCRSEYRGKDGRYVPYCTEYEEPLHMHEEELVEQILNE